MGLHDTVVSTHLCMRWSPRDAQGGPGRDGACEIAKSPDFISPPILASAPHNPCMNGTSVTCRCMTPQEPAQSRQSSQSMPQTRLSRPASGTMCLRFAKDEEANRTASTRMHILTACGSWACGQSSMERPCGAPLEGKRMPAPVTQPLRLAGQFLKLLE